MKITATWSKTNDQLIFQSINDELSIWFVQQCQKLGNRFAIGTQVTDIPRRSQNTSTLISEIEHDVDRVNEFLPKIRQPRISKPTDWCDQDQLNNLHKAWARTREQVPHLPELLWKLDRSLYDCYQEMNCHIHLIETSFNYAFRDNETHWRVDNPFKDTFYDWQSCHLYISYPGHGRAAFEKFQSLDKDVYQDDNCNWNMIDSYIGISLSRPYKTTPPSEFLSWCKIYDLVPHTYTLPLANLEDWQNNLSNSRNVVMNNVIIPDNHFSLEIFN